MKSEVQYLGQMTVKGSILKQELLRNFWKSTFMSFDTQEIYNAVIEFQ